ncbi:MAG: L-threonylcarbamoyladenylate synthase [Chlamydiota bacterium]
MKTEIYTYLTKPLLQQVKHFLQEGQLVAFPTETVYGLGALFGHEEAKKAVYQVKNRPLDNPCIVHVASFAMSTIEPLTQLDPNHKAFLEKLGSFFPGPLTLILPAHPRIQRHLGGKTTVALRAPDHPLALEILRTLKKPLIAPSANLSGKPSPTCAADVLHDLGGNIACIVDGGSCSIGLESTVLDLTDSPRILRPGVITKEALGKALSLDVKIALSDKGRSPGVAYPHYAPNAQVVLFENLKELDTFDPEETLLLSYKRALFPRSCPFFKKNLYALFRKADTLKKKTIGIYLDKTLLQEEDLMNRIEKAAISGR